ncbi:hypothetical protein CSKR_106202 [Clonorchis sinensis]|uniref:Uncharacterized protein n=1 Tax=Clonorchis sinensis TaxID=79923 RepID=A0A419PTZ0_CLOSI|nr:hypothetical protein CSKR_106202 [Clonorchis sinensis]
MGAVVRTRPLPLDLLSRLGQRGSILALVLPSGGIVPKWLEREFTERKDRGSNPTSASRLPLSRLRQPGSVLALVQPSGGMAVRHRRGATAERFFYFNQHYGRCTAEYRSP